MFWYESGSPETPGSSTGINIELSTREVMQWQENDWDKIQEVERYALFYGMQERKLNYFVKSAENSFLAYGTIAELKAKYPDMTSESNA